MTTKSAQLLRLTTALMGSTLFVRGDGTPPATTTNPPANSNPPATGERTMTQAQWEAQRQQELAARSHTDLIAQLIRVETDAHNLRRRQVPEGGRLLSREEAQRYDAYLALGDDPAAIRTELDAGRAATTDLAARQRGDQIREAAEVAGYNPRVLQTLIPEGAELIINPPAAGQTARTVSFRPPPVNNQQQAPVALTEHARAHWADFMPSLTARTVTPGTQQQQPAGFVAQDSANTNAGSASWVQQQLNAQPAATYRDPLQPGNVGQSAAVPNAAPAASTQQGS